QGLLDLPTVDYAHVPLVVGPSGQRLAKRDGSVTRAELAAAGVTNRTIVGVLGGSLGLPSDGVGTAADLLVGFDLDTVRRLGPEPIAWTDLQRSLL
ncbi:MAG: tRNA glutamyl-Q(34) synthetase GluQRS, partial [Desertimonas sp.]